MPAARHHAGRRIYPLMVVCGASSRYLVLTDGGREYACLSLDALRLAMRLLSSARHGLIALPRDGVPNHVVDRLARRGLVGASWFKKQEV